MFNNTLGAKMPHNLVIAAHVRAVNAHARAVQEASWAKERVRHVVAVETQRHRPHSRAVVDVQREARAAIGREVALRAACYDTSPSRVR